MQRIKSSTPTAAHARPARLAKLHKLDGISRLDVREELWWSRRLACGADWMDEWISRPVKR